MPICDDPDRTAGVVVYWLFGLYRENPTVITNDPVDCKVVLGAGIYYVC
jgi:hypothetical protein